MIAYQTLLYLPTFVDKSKPQVPHSFAHPSLVATPIVRSNNERMEIARFSGRRWLVRAMWANANAGRGIKSCLRKLVLRWALRQLLPDSELVHIPAKK